ncbi:MAG: hypothetical protein HXY47_01985 [Nitrospirae bacterium]|nr:hypothetical protein [Nitrospirota bacterium]
MRNLLSKFRVVKFKDELSKTKEQLQKKYYYFQIMLSETNAVRKVMADMEEKLSGDYLFDMNYIRTNSKFLADKVHTIIDALNEISNGKYLELYDVFKRTNSEIQAILNRKREIGEYIRGVSNIAGEKGTSLSKLNKPTPLKECKVIIDRGIVAFKGIGTGNAYLVSKEKDLDNFPDRAVLVARNISPNFIKVMDKAAAIVTDAGSANDYVVSIARDFKIPTILNTKIATKLITTGMEITVDSINGNVYEGHVNEVIQLGQKKENLFKNTHILKTLEEVLKKIVPLNLVYLRVDTFKPELCKTFHDITHFVNEISLEEMFKISNRPNIKGGEAVRLILKIPLKIYVIDLNSGILTSSEMISIDNISSIPMNAFLKGILSMRWPGPRPKNVSGLASVVANITIDPSIKRDRGWGKSFAIISREYMNFNIRLGYHLSTVEAYTCDNIYNNYIRFHFKGGGASIDRRIRRTRLIEEILKKLDFDVDRIGDMLNACINRHERSVIEEKLNILGRLTVYTKQLDMIMFSDAFVDCYLKEFIKEYCSI